MSLEPCPFCGKRFKRLKSHLPHCKMSPGSKTAKSNKAKELLNTTPTDTSQKDTKGHVFDKKLYDPSLQATSKAQVKSKKVNVNALSAEEGNTDAAKPRGKWLAKREQEMAKQVTFLTQKGSKFTSESVQEKLSCVSETPKGQVKGTQGQNQKRLGLKDTALTSAVTTTEIDISASDLQLLSWTKCGKAERSIPKHTSNTKVMEEKQNSQMPLSSDLALITRVKEQYLTLFTTKTCVWDHIKHGLYDRRSYNVPEFYTRGAAQVMSVSDGENISVSVQTEKYQNCVEKANSAPLFSFPQTIQRSAEDILTSKLQSKNVKECSPEMTTGYGKLYCPHSGMPSNEDLRTKCQSSKPPSHSKGAVTEQRLGDVRLCELASWLGARTPKSPKDAVTMLNKGWQWYYRKYIDVQKGGIGGISMLIVGYCVLSYIWSYPHLKKERWRKYH